MYINCQKIKAFELFEDGLRPAEVFNSLSLKKRTLYRYFQEWKSKKIIEKLKADLSRLRRQIKNRIKDVEREIADLRSRPGNHSDQVVKWQRAKRRAEELLNKPFSATAAERKMLADYSD